jgi:hypothetical protein
MRARHSKRDYVHTALRHDRITACVTAGPLSVSERILAAAAAKQHGVLQCIGDAIG